MIRAWIESALALAAGVLGVVTLAWPSWIEALTGADPDGGNGDVEWMIVIALAVVAAVMALLARRDFRRARGAARPAPSA